MTKEEQREAFLAAIRKEPEEVVHHGAFADWLDENDEPEEADFHRAWTLNRYNDAKEFLKGLAIELGYTVDENEYSISNDYESKRITFGMLIEAGHNWINTWEEYGNNCPDGDGDYFVQVGSERARYVMGREGMMKKFWEAWQLITSIRVQEKMKQRNIFSCTC